MEGKMPKKLLKASLLLALLLVTGSCQVETKSQRTINEAWANLPVPRLGVRDFVWVHVPQIPGCVIDLSCYEHNAMLSHRRLSGGGLELQHRDTKDPNILLITTITPEPGAVEVIARAEVDRERNPEGKLPEEMPAPNLCFQVKRAEGGFSHFPDPFPEFIRRCFIYTDRGRTFLLNTIRHRLPEISDKPDDPRNNPPHVQVYYGMWRYASLKPGPKRPGWYTTSPTRYIIPVIGIVSRDGKHLAAMATDSADSMCQAWQQCLHNNPKWTPEDVPPEERRWRVKIYIMPNDSKALLKRFKEDFPDASKLREKYVPARKPR